ncbi:MAG: hypothetical protein Q7U28_10325 [Aquabacterium sp.]|nr:hypothetical protein [Aquabacterium sp.]
MAKHACVSMKNRCVALALALPVWAFAAPAVYGPVTVSDNHSAVAAVVAVKGTTGQGAAGVDGLPLDKLPCQGKVCNAIKKGQDLSKDSLIDLRNVTTPDATLNVNSVKLRGSLTVGKLNVLNNDADLLLSIGGQVNVNGISIGGQ